MESRRRCGWLAKESDAAANSIIWARGKVSVPRCPVSHITPESITLLEEYHVWKLFGRTDYQRLPARLVEAMFILENELRLEQSDGEE